MNLKFFNLKSLVYFSILCSFLQSCQSDNLTIERKAVIEMEIEKIDFTKLVPRRIGPRKRLNDEELLHLLNKSTKSSGVGDVDKEIEKSQQKKIEGLKNARSVMKDRKIPENIQKIIQKSFVELLVLREILPNA